MDYVLRQPFPRATLSTSTAHSLADFEAHYCGFRSTGRGRAASTRRMHVRAASESFEFLDRRLQEFVQAYSLRLPDPVERLEYVRLCAARASRYPKLVRNSPFWILIANGLALDCLLRARCGFRAGLPWHQRLAVASFRTGQSALGFVFPKRWAIAALGAPLIVMATAANVNDWTALETAPPEPTVVSVVDEPIWHVETKGEFELYSNGLRISNEFVTEGESKAMPVMSGGRGLDLHSLDGRIEWRNGPIGVVYHTTVSDAIPSFAEQNNDLIRQKSSSLLRYIRREKLYNFVIDRFGRAFRIVPETQTAFHAGFSMWGHGHERYIDLNDGFIGVAFETRPEAVDPDADKELTVTAAQVATARLLTQVIRKLYNIPTQNCITHEMVAVNPSDMLIGRHTDWAGRFPFEQVGLPDNYELPLHSIADWGFSYGRDLVRTLGGEVWPGISEGERMFGIEARSRGMTEDQFRQARRKVFGELRIKLKSERQNKHDQRAAEPTD